MSSTRRKSDVLGMPFGTACHRLRKMALFSVLARHGENVCFQCGLPILTPEQLSLEHKLPLCLQSRPLERLAKLLQIMSGSRANASENDALTPLPHPHKTKNLMHEG